MRTWLMKSEPYAYSWTRLKQEGHTWWEGVRNYQANNNMKAMMIGDKAFFYHSTEGKCVMGVMRIQDEWRLDPDDEKGRFGMVGVVPVEPLPTPVTLAAMKAHPLLAGMALFKQSRLSVAPITAEEWSVVSSMGGLSAAKTAICNFPQ
jgi:predicted RNA-binding protein with PUA-like domain